MIAWLKAHARLAALVTAAVILVAVAVAGRPQRIQGEEPMAKATTTPGVAIRKIGVETPAVPETATFAMG